MEDYFVEVTDTFGDEANYSWVHRFRVRASSERGAMRKVSTRLPYAGGVSKGWDSGDTQQWKWNRASVCAFVQMYEGQAESMKLEEL